MFALWKVSRKRRGVKAGKPGWWGEQRWHYRHAFKMATLIQFAFPINQLWLVNGKPVKPGSIYFGQTFVWMLLCGIVLEELNAVPLPWATDVCWRVCLYTPQSSTRLDRKSSEPWENNTWGQGRASCSSSQSPTEEGERRLSSQLHFSLCLFAHLCLLLAATHSFLL